jgi:hypothetical protein
VEDKNERKRKMETILIESITIDPENELTVLEVNGQYINTDEKTDEDDMYDKFNEMVYYFLGDLCKRYKLDGVDFMSGFHPTNINQFKILGTTKANPLSAFDLFGEDDLK